MHVSCPQALETVGIGIKASMGGKDICDHSREFEGFRSCLIPFLGHAEDWAASVSALGLSLGLVLSGYKMNWTWPLLHRGAWVYSGREAPGTPTCVMEREEGRRDRGQESGFRRRTQVLWSRGEWWTLFLPCLQTHSSSCMDVSCYSCVSIMFHFMEWNWGTRMGFLFCFLPFNWGV